MATANQTARDKFLEARKAGVDAVTARKQAYGDVMPAQAGGVVQAQPVSGVPPVPTNAPTPAPIVPQVTGVDGQKFTQAPVDPTTGLSTPIAPTTVTPTPTVPVVAETPAPVKTEVASTKTKPVVDYTQAQGREQEIITNLEKFKAQNMTPEQIKSASGYAQATPEKKAIIEGFLNPVKQDAGTIFSTLRAGGSVPTSDTPEFRQAQARYNTFKRFSTYDVASLSTAMQSGDLLMGTQAYNDVISDPSTLAKIQKARIFMNGEVDMVKIGEKQGQYVMTQNPTVAKALEDGYMSAEEYNSLTSNPEVEAQARVVSDIKTQYDEYKRQLENISDDVDAEYEGKFTTDSFRSAIKANRDKAIRRLFNSASDDLQNASGLYTELKNSSTQRLELNMKQYEQQQADARQIASEQRAMDNSLALSQMEFDQKLAQQAQLASDPVTGVNNIVDTFEKMGIFADRSRQEMVQEVQSKMAQGMTVGEALSDLQTAFKSKPLYKSMMDAQMRSLAPESNTPTSKWEVIGKNTDGTDKYGFINEATSTVTPYLSPTGEVTGDLRYLADQFPNQAWAKNNNPAGISWNSNFDKGTGTAKLLADAGIQFTKGTARPANEGGNYVTFATIEDGLRAQQIMMTQTYGNSTVGNMLSSWVGTSEGPNYAKQVAGMAGISDLNQNVSSLSQEQLGALQMAKIQKESPGLGRLLTQGTGTTGTTGTQASVQYTDQNIADLSYLTELQEKNPTQAAKDMKELGYTARDLANYKSGNMPLTEKQKTTSFDVMSAIKDLTNNDRYEWNDAVGKFDPTRIIGSQDAEDANVAINNLVAKLTLPNLGVLKGPMSDKDIQFIKEASSKLSTTQSNKSFERNLIDAYNLAARRAGQPEIKNLSELSGDTQSTVGGESEYSKYE